MKTPYKPIIKNSFAIIILGGMLVACAPPASLPQQSGNLSLEMRRLQSTLDKQQQSIQQLSTQVAELQEKQQRQTREIEQMRQQARPAQTSYSPTGLPRATDSSAPSMSGGGSPTEVYLQAFGDYASGRYQAAINGFESFLQRFPNNSYASNAQFWLADCYFNQQQYATAIQEFNRVINDYQGAPKNPDALYKIAIASLQLGSSDDARSAIEILNQNYPKSTATQKAKDLVIP